MEKALLVDIIDHKTSQAESELRLKELDSLVSTYGGINSLQLVQKKDTPAYKTFVGSGKIEEMLDDLENPESGLRKKHGKKLKDGLKSLDVIIVNNIMKPRQIYNLEELCIEYQNRKYKEAVKRDDGSAGRFELPHKIKVWDRIDLILKIFDKHAKSVEAKLQIELASIKHMGPRIFGMGMELSRQTGGIGTVGAGESNTQMMKRHLQTKTKAIEEKIKYYANVQKRHREQRRDRQQKTISVVGYTNAGKSTMLKAITKKQDVYIADELFATLDSKVGELYLPKSYKTALMADTIGFIQDLPPELIDAFKSTLAEIVDADMLLHVIDINDKNIHHKITVVEEILEALGAQDKPKVYVFNKIDKLEERVAAGEITEEEMLDYIADLSERYAEFTPQLSSAIKRKELDLLKEMLEDKLATIY